MATRKKKTPKTRRALVPRPRRPRRVRHVAALVRFKGNSAKIRAWVPASRGPRRSILHDVAITDSNWTDFAPGAGEIVVSFHDRDGNHLESTAWWARADYFGDRRAGKAGQITGGQRPPRIDERVLHTDVPAGATYLVFHRIAVEKRSERARPSRLKYPRTLEGDGAWGPVRLTVHLLGVYLLPDIDPEPDFCPELFPLPFLWPGFLRWLLAQRFLHFPPSGWKLKDPPRKGWVDSRETVHSATSPEGKFHIVILGEGYAEGQLTAFDDAAKRLATKMLETEPFQSLAQYLEIDIIRCVSYDSGVTRCPGTTGFDCSSDYEELETYFAVEGCWVDTTGPECLGSAPTFLGTAYPEYVYAAAEEVAPFENVGLYIVLANVDTYGGSAFRSQKLAFVTVYGDDELFYGVGLHESAHVLGDLVEEYISPLPWDSSTPRNVVQEDAKDTVWWTALASNSELRISTGELKNVVTCPDDPEDGECHAEYNSPTLSDAADPDVLGLFWGAQFIDPEDDPCDMNLLNWDSWTNRLGNHFYRPMARCKMRVVTWDFCRVCAAEIEDAIRGGLV